jgi:hypothetical protein
MAEPDRPHDNTTRHMRVACWITKVTDTHSEYVIDLLIAFPWQQCLSECAPVLCYSRLLVLFTIKPGLQFGHHCAEG